MNWLIAELAGRVGSRCDAQFSCVIVALASADVFTWLILQTKKKE